MKKTITSLLATAIIATAAAQTIPVQVKSMPGQNVTQIQKKVQLAEQTRALPTLNKMTRAGGVTFGAKFILDSKLDQYVYTLYAVPSDDRMGVYYDPDQETLTDFTFQLPEGTYDFMGIIDDDEAAKRIILIMEDVKVAAGMEDLVFDQASATASTRISHVDSEGTRLVLPSYTEENNCDYGDFIDLVSHNGVLVWAGEPLAMMECNYILITNKPDSRFEIVRSDIIGARGEAVSYVIPVDYSKEVCGPTSSEGWQVSDQEFVKTPIMNNYDEYYNEKLGHPDYFTFITRGILIGDDWWGSTGLGVFDAPCNAARVAMWAPADYDGMFDVAISPTSNVFSGDDSSITGLPLMRGDNALVQVGLNFASGSKTATFIGTAAARSIKRQNERYATVPAPGKRANAVPVLFACSDFSGFFYTYKGRFGEDLSFDAFDILSSMENEKLMNQLGGQPSNIEIYADGKLICANRHALSQTDWVEGAENKAVVTMKNVLIDGEIEGCNTSTVVWNASKGNGFAPTVTGLQFRDVNDAVVDNFNTSSDGVIEFTVGGLSMEYSEKNGYFYYDIAPIQGVKVEYAPHGSSEFSAIEVTEIPELFFNPGYGYFYRGSLAGVNRGSADGWFDLRLTATDNDGAYIEQVLSPAFRVADLTGVGVSEIYADKTLGYTISGRDIIAADGVSVYTPDGRRCRPTALLPGLYIVTDGRHAEKVVIK